MNYVLIGAMVLFFSSAVAKHHDKDNPPCNHESLGEAWGETT